MKTTAPASRFRDFYHAQLDTLLRVEESDGRVVVRATSNRFSPERKLAFIRWLADEGFIAENFRWASLAGVDEPGGVCWVKDLSWARLDPQQQKRTDRIMRRVLGYSALAWAVMMMVVLTR